VTFNVLSKAADPLHCGAAAAGNQHVLQPIARTGGLPTVRSVSNLSVPVPKARGVLGPV